MIIRYYLRGLPGKADSKPRFSDGNGQAFF